MDESGKCARHGANVEEIHLTGTLFLAAQEHSRQGRRKREGVEGRDGDGKRNRQRELAVENAGGAWEERNRNEDGDEHQRCGDDGAGYFAHGPRCSFVGIGMLHGDVSLHVFDDHDGVVNYQSCGQRDAEKGERVDGEAEDLDEGKCADQRNRNSDGGNDGGAPVQQEQEDDHDDDGDGFGQGHEHFADGVADHGCGIESDGVFEAGGKALGEFLQRSLGGTVHFQGIGVGELLDADTMSVVPQIFE